MSQIEKNAAKKERRRSILQSKKNLSPIQKSGFSSFQKVEVPEKASKLKVKKSREGSILNKDVKDDLVQTGLQKQGTLNRNNRNKRREEQARVIKEQKSDKSSQSAALKKVKNAVGLSMSWVTLFYLAEKI